jgi:hypothetical protein
MQDQHAACMQVCNDCAAACEHTAIACLDGLGSTPRECIKLSQECALVCRLLSALIARDSRVSRDVALVAAKVCDLAAKECDKWQIDHCNLCAELCRNCADECRRLANPPAKSNLPRA